LSYNPQEELVFPACFSISGANPARVDGKSSAGTRLAGHLLRRDEEDLMQLTANEGEGAIREYPIEMPRIVLNGRETGSGQVAIFMHGITAVGAVWDPILDITRKSFRSIAVDQRGHGRSGKPAGDYSATAFADDALALIEALDCGPAVLVGHSLGARNAVVAATRRPDLVSSVVAVDFTPYIEDEVFTALESRVNGGDRLFDSVDDVETYLQNRYVNLPPDAVRRRARHGYQKVEAHYRPLADPAAMTATAKGLREDLVAAFSEVAVPVVLVRGAQSRLVSPAAWEQTKRLRPDMKAIEVDDTDHYVPEEAPEAIAAIVLSAHA
jgi:2-(acetamidomethylene)succinate hydrolase